MSLTSSFLPGFLEAAAAAAVFLLLLGAPCPACPPSDPDPAGLPEDSGAAAAPG